MQQATKLSADDRSTIRSAVLEARDLLESEFERQLERYGVREEERISIDDLGHLSIQDRETRRKIDAAIERELGATEDYERAYRNYVREAAKEYLNRYVGLKTIEARGLVTETISTKAEYGNRSYLHYTVDEVAGELTESSDDGLGVALDLAFQEIGAEIRVLYENTEYTAIDPDWTVRRNVFEELAGLDDDAWAADEAMGWVYQYFGENEREEIDDRIAEENYKVKDTDIATKTQLFTPRYIVEWMVDNSLGRLWLEMYGDQTSIDDEDKCFFLAPLEESLIERDVKDVREIKVLDPACGSGHMLFYAFDVLYEMYLEQGDVPEEEIPGEILKHNLYGIDIDPGAVQIAALSLYAKAKEREPEVAIEQINVISADAVLVNGEKKQEVLDRVDTELEERVLEQIWRSFENIREWGSLVRIEERIEEIVEEELERIESTGQAEFTGDGRLAKQASVVSFEGDTDESWETVKATLLERVAALAEEALEHNDPVGEMFMGEVEKSVELLDYFVGGYDLVVTNPPYLGSGKIGSDLKQFIKDNYIGTRDVYAPFIERCWEFAGEEGYVSMVTQENFMFLSSYSKLRAEIIRSQHFIEGLHLSRNSFAIGERPATIPFVMKNDASSNFKQSRFYRMTHEQEEYAKYQDKRRGVREITAANRRNETHKDVYCIDQNLFSEMGRTPFIYWFGEEILQLFTRYPKVDDACEVLRGLDTGDDDRFVRKSWEVRQESLGSRWMPYMMSGEGRMYFESIRNRVLWENNGEEIKEFEGSIVPNEEYYSKSGFGYRSFGKYFVVRHLPEGCIPSDTSPAIYPYDETSPNTLLGYLNSSLVRYVMNGINPSMRFQVGDVEQMFIDKNMDSEEIDGLVSSGIDIQEKIQSLNEVNSQFDPQMLLSEDMTEQLYLENIRSSDLAIVHDLIDELIFEYYDISTQSQEIIYGGVPKKLIRYPRLVPEDKSESIDSEFSSEVAIERVSTGEYDDLVEKIEDKSGNDLREISEGLEVSPYTVATLLHEHDLYTRDEKQQAAGRLLSYYLGCIMGRWDLEGLEPDEDGIVVFDESFEDNVTSLVQECIELTYSADELYERETEIEDMLGKGYVDWLRESFFRYHHCKEYRRRGQRIPIYWQLESDEGTFSCFLYYHAMDADTLSKLRGQYVDAKIRLLQNRLGSLEREIESANEDKKRTLRNEIEETQNQLDDVKDFGERLDALINAGFEPDFEAGIWENIQKVDEYDLLQTPLDKL